MRTIHFTIGPPGCGKTTFANNMVRERSDIATVQLDGIRAALFGSKRAFWDNPSDDRRLVVRKAYGILFKNLLKNTKLDIILPNTNLNVHFYDHAVALAAEFDCRIEVHVFDAVTLGELLERNAIRPMEDRLEPHIVEEYWQAFADPEAYWRKLG